LSGWEGPSVRVPGESEVDEPAEVQCCGPGREGDAVAFDAPVADPAVSVRDEPCNGAFHEGPIRTVVADVVVVIALLGACSSEEFVVVADVEGPASGGRGAPVTDGTVPAFGTERGFPGGADRHSDLVGAGDRCGLIVDGEAVSDVLIVAKTPVTGQRYRFDHGGVPSCLNAGSHRSKSSFAAVIAADTAV
jgi:hypothetical protein